MFIASIYLYSKADSVTQSFLFFRLLTFVFVSLRAQIEPPEDRKASIVGMQLNAIAFSSQNYDQVFRVLSSPQIISV
jgi:hypothetical protein